MPKLVTLTICACIFLFRNAYASAPPDITDEEIALLPTYCPYTQSFKPGITMGAKNHPKSEAWLRTVGPGFWSLHHYCWALVQIRRAESPKMPSEIRKGTHQAAIGNIDFVIRNSPGDLVLLPELYTWIGRLELKLKRPELAQQAFNKAKSIKGDYWPAYFHWAEYLHSTNKNREALQTTIDGLSNSPNAKSLIELRKTLESIRR